MFNSQIHKTTSPASIISARKEKVNDFNVKTVHLGCESKRPEPVEGCFCYFIMLLTTQNTSLQDLVLATGHPRNLIRMTFFASILDET